MKKQRIQLLVLLGVLLVLAGGYFGIKQYNKAQADRAEAEQASGSEGEQLVLLAPEDIVKLSYDYEDNHYEYIKEDGTWYYAADRELSINQSRMESMLSNIAPLIVQETITGVTDLAQYGLNEPSGTIAFESLTGSYLFHVGDYNSMNSIYYIGKPSDDTVYTVSATVVNGLLVDVMDIVEESTEESTAEEGAGAESPEEEDKTEENTQGEGATEGGSQ